VSAETAGKTPDSLSVIAGALEHLTVDLHQVIKALERQGSKIDRLDGTLTEWEPLMSRFRSPAAAMTAGRRARRQARNG
jgi:hypothetical protein